MATSERSVKPKRKESAGKLSDPAADVSNTNTDSVPAPKEEVCPDCSKAVNEKDKAVSCDICNFWFHKSCQGISDQLYKVLNSQETDSISWYCSGCKRGAKKVMLQLVRIRERQDIMEVKISTMEDRHDKTDQKVQMIESSVEKLDDQDNTGASELVDPHLAVREIEDRERRKSNIVLFNLPESSSEDAKVRQAADHTDFKSICQSQLDVGVVEVEAAYRLGPKEKNGRGSRPLKVILKDIATKKQILTNAKKLKNTEDSGTKQIAIAPDLTKMQREEMRKLRVLQKSRQEELKRSGDHVHTWIIRDGKLQKVRVKQN